MEKNESNVWMDHVVTSVLYADTMMDMMARNMSIYMCVCVGTIGHSQTKCELLCLNDKACHSSPLNFVADKM